MRTRAIARRLAVLTLLSLMPAAAQAQSGAVAGRVTEVSTGAPIVGAVVRIRAGIQMVSVAQSDSDGRFRIAGVPVGTYAVEARRIGYEAVRLAGIEVTAGATAVADLSMKTAAVQLNPTVTTASRGAAAEKVLDTPASISVVTAELMGTQPAPLVTDYLKTLPGVSILSGGLMQANVVTRGFNNVFSTLLLGLQDYRFTGLPAVKGNLPFLYTATNEDIERIEVLNGPAAALYGPNAANGVMHIITKSPFDSRGSILTLDGGSSFQSVGGVTPGEQFRLGGRTAMVFGARENWGAKLTGEYFTGTDWPDADPNLPAVYPSIAPPERAGLPIRRARVVARYAGEARVDYRSDSRAFENIFAAGYTMILHSNEMASAFGPTEGRNWSYTSLQNRVRYKQFFGQVFYNGSSSGNASASDPSGSFYLTTGLPIVDDSRVFVAQGQQGFDLGPAKMIAGVDYIHTQPRSLGTLYGRFETTPDLGSITVVEQGAYLHGSIPLRPQWEVVAAARGDMNNRLEGVQFSPHAALVYKPNASNSLRATFGRAFNSPIGFEFFVDQIANPQQAPGFALRVMGNPAKTGWRFDRGCDANVNLGLCMRSPWAAQGGGAAIPSTAANAFPGFVAALPGIINALPTLTNADKAALTGLLATLNPILAPLRPTAADVGSYLFGSAPIAAADVTDIDPRRASFNNTFELGYKGIVKQNFRVALDLWYQVRGDVGAPVTLATPLVMYDPASLGSYLEATIRQGLIDGGETPANAQATATAAAGALAPLMAAFPQGTLAFTNPLNSDPSIFLTFTNGTGQLHVHGADLAVDYQPDLSWLLSATYSYQDKIVFPEIGGAANPLMSNSPMHRASGGVRYTTPLGRGFSSTLRYADYFPANSGYYNSLVPNAFSAAFTPNPPVPAQVQLDAGAWWRWPGRGLTLSLNVSNLLDNQVPNFVGTPAIGRLIMSRVKYEF